MLDRKEEHLDTGNRPSATAQIKAGVSADGMLTAFDAESWGTGGAGAAARLPAALHLPVPEPPPHAQGRLHQRRPAARRCARRAIRRACFLTEILMDELADAVKMDPVEFRIKNLPPEAPERDVAHVPPRRARRSSAGTSVIRPATRRPGRSRPAWACAVDTVGRRRPRPARRTCEITSDGSVRRAVRHAGHRHRHADDRRDGRGRDARPAASAPSSRRSATRMYPFSGGSGGSTTAAGVSPAIRIACGQGARRAEREGRAGARRRRRRRSSRRTAAFTSRTIRRRACRGRMRAS